MLSDEQKKRGVISASLGNHAQGLSYHAKSLDIPCTVVMPVAAPIMKIQKCRSYGANVIVHVILVLRLITHQTLTNFMLQGKGYG